MATAAAPVSILGGGGGGGRGGRGGAARAPRSVRFDASVIDEAEQTEWMEDSSCEGSDSEGSDAGSVVMEDSFFTEPADDPDLLQWQFRVAMENKDLVFLEKLLRTERQRVRAGELEYEIPPMDKAKHLALAMLSNEEDVYKALAQHISIHAADDWFSSTHPASRCECEDGHKGSLLVRLVRAGLRQMVSRALKGGLDPNAVICDGDMERMYWNVDNPDTKRETAKLEAVFRKETALTAAAALDDVRMLELLLGYGADPTAGDYSGFAVAARYGHTTFLQALLADQTFDDFAKMERGCVVALKSASMAEQDSTIDWLLLRLQQFDDWETQMKPRKKSLTSGVSRSLGRRTFGSLKKKRRPKSTGSITASSASASSSTHSHSSLSSKSGSSKQLVGEALTYALEELIEDGKEPGSVMRQSLTTGIENVLLLQRKHFQTTQFDPRELLAFYISSASDDDIFTPEDVATRLLSLGLAEYLMGNKSSIADAPRTERRGALKLSEEDLALRRASRDDDSHRSRAVSRHPHAGAVGPGPAGGLVMDQTRTRLKALTLVTTRMLRNVVNSVAGNKQYFQQPARSGSIDYKHRVASEKERRSAVLSAAQVGHRSVLGHLITLCSDTMLESLLVQATRYHQKDTVVFLLDTIAERRRDSAPTGLAPSELKLDKYTLATTLMAALGVGDLEIAQIVLEQGAELSTVQVTQTLEEIVTSTSKLAAKGIPKTLDLATSTDFGAVQLEHVLDVALEASSPNLRALKVLLSRTRTHFVKQHHLLRLVHKSCGKSSEESWRTVADLMVKNLLCSEDEAQAKKDLNALLFEAETLPHIHVGVLTLLMHSCEMDPDTDADEGMESDGMPSRWL